MSDKTKCQCECHNPDSLYAPDSSGHCFVCNNGLIIQPVAPTSTDRLGTVAGVDVHEGEKVTIKNGKVSTEPTPESLDTTTPQADLLKEAYQLGEHRILDGSLAPILAKMNDLLSQAKSEGRREELEFMKRLKLEVDVVVCDCGEPWKESDMADLINARIQALTTPEDTND